MSDNPFREMRTLLRAIVKNGYGTIDSYEEPCCFYCRADNHTGRAKHAPGCIYVRAKELLARIK